MLPSFIPEFALSNTKLIKQKYNYMNDALDRKRHVISWVRSLSLAPKGLAIANSQNIINSTVLSVAKHG